MKLTIGIKALNEEAHIADALESALKVAALYDGEVVLADSGSTDRTIEIASTYPVRIVQLADPAEKSCGTGAQLAFQGSDSDYFYLLDGDMILDPGFLPEALTFMQANPSYAAVGGRVVEANTDSLEYQIRANSVRAGRNWGAGDVDRLDCGGLYRSAAVRQAGFLADRNLHAFEEFELGARLRSLGWKLARIDKPALLHFGHQTDSYALLWRRMKSGYSAATGEVLRAAVGQKHLPQALELEHVRIGVVIILFWLALVATLFMPMPILWHVAGPLAALLAALLFLVYRRGSLAVALYSFTAWNVSALGLVTGFFRRRKLPGKPIASVVIKAS